MVDMIDGDVGENMNKTFEISTRENVQFCMNIMFLCDVVITIYRGEMLSRAPSETFRVWNKYIRIHHI